MSIALLLAIIASPFVCIFAVAGWSLWQHYTWDRAQLESKRRTVAAHNKWLDEFEAKNGAGAVRKTGTRTGRASLRKVRTGPTIWEWRVEYDDHGFRL